MNFLCACVHVYVCISCDKCTHMYQYLFLIPISDDLCMFLIQINYLYLNQKRNNIYSNISVESIIRVSYACKIICLHACVNVSMFVCVIISVCNNSKVRKVQISLISNEADSMREHRDILKRRYPPKYGKNKERHRFGK